MQRGQFCGVVVTGGIVVASGVGKGCSSNGGSISIVGGASVRLGGGIVLHAVISRQHDTVAVSDFFSNLLVLYVSDAVDVLDGCGLGIFVCVVDTLGLGCSVASLGLVLPLPVADDKYRRRKAIVEPPNAWIKQVLGFRQFSFKGIDKVRCEFKLVCAALNLRRMAAMGV